MHLPSSAELSVVMPVLDEADQLAASLGSLPAAVPGARLVVVDGGSRDGSPRLVESWRHRLAAAGIELQLLRSAPGRALQMNRGAAAARGDVLLFLHGDTELPPHAGALLRHALELPGVQGGAFRHRFRERSALLRLVSWGSNLRSRLWGSFYGDQALFLRRSAFEALGGYRPLPVFEDLDLAQRLAGRGRVVLLPAPVRTSGRRFLRSGVVRTLWRMSRMKRAHRRGAAPESIVGDYWEEGRRGTGGGARS